jgi:hypothetical protein
METRGPLVAGSSPCLGEVTSLLVELMSTSPYKGAKKLGGNVPLSCNKEKE